MKKLWIVIVVILIIIIGLAICAHLSNKFPKPNTQKDEAMLAGRDGKSMPGADEDYYADMDYGFTKNPEAVRQAVDPYIHGVSAADAVKAVAVGRNNWVVWTGGNDRLWDKLNGSSVGNLDLLKTISNYGPYTRDNRWSWYGLVNEPCFKKNTQPRPDRWGLILDARVETPDCKPDPFENDKKYPGVAYGARGKGKLALGSYYGYGTGIIGLRLFPNPAFDDDAQKKWDPVRYYNDPSYYNRADLVKPYRVGMSCGFCHVGPNPTNPPADPENPKWENLNSNPGAQYFWIERIFMFDQDQKSFVWQLFHTSRPGALDTSLVSSDEINNPRTMNAIYSLKARIEIAKKWGAEKLQGGSADNKQFEDYVPPLSAGTPLTTLYDKNTKTALTTHVLKDGSDSVGALGALNRVYLNIGLFSEDWLTHFIPLIGGPKTSPILISYCRQASSYWNANEAQTPFTGLFFLVTAQPDLLAKAPGGADELAKGAAMIPRGKEVFAERCARCHSSKIPQPILDTYFKPGCIGPNYLKCWNDYWAATKTQPFKDAMKAEVNKPDFLVDNFLSNEVRVPVTLLETNACSPLATNAIANDIWDNFSSQSYKELPAVGDVTVHDPYTYKPSTYTMPAGGRGYTRPASLISLWSTAPFLQNNSVGDFYESGSVKDRLTSFDGAIRQMLWPDRRKSNPPGAMFVTKSGKMAPGWIDTTTERTFLNVPSGYLGPGEKFISGFAGLLDWLFPNVFDKGAIRLGPIPKGTPVNLLSNLNIGPEGFKATVPVVLKMKHALDSLPADPPDDQVKAKFAPLVPDMLRVSKCADFVVNRGHYFGTDFLPPSEGEPGLSDADKEALIAFLKTF